MIMENMKATIFLRYRLHCREVHNKDCWECKTGNVLTRSVISADQAIRLHKEKLFDLGIVAGDVIYKGSE